MPYREPESFRLAADTNQYRSTQYRDSKHDRPTGQYEEVSETDRIKERRLRGGIHVMNTEALALANLTQLYETDPLAQKSFSDAVEAITRQAATKSKLVIIGVGKSGLIGKKLVATFQSLAVRAVFLHPTEALHGDLGIVGPDDTLLFITYSGSTQELLAVLPHLDESLPTILMTSHTRPDACEFVKRRPGTILLPAPVHEAEKISFGVSAPTTSTTAALALGDALAMTAAHELHPNVASAFAKNHPGGAIGVAAAASKRRVPPHQARTLRQISVTWDEIHDASHLGCDGTGASLLRAGYGSANGWVRVGEDIVSPGQMQAMGDDDLLRSLGELRGTLLVSCHDMLAMSAETTVRQARDMLRGARGSGSDGEDNGAGLDDDGTASAGTASSVIAITENGRICGVVEATQVFAPDE